MDPSMTLSGLSANKRGQLWRYLCELMPQCPELPEVRSKHTLTVICTRTETNVAFVPVLLTESFGCAHCVHGNIRLCTAHSVLVTQLSSHLMAW